jgi:hypothetical protein
VEKRRNRRRRIDETGEGAADCVAAVVPFFLSSTPQGSFYLGHSKTTRREAPALLLLLPSSSSLHIRI